jgi:3-hydroxyisobutyrate dehydrogenase-like beta-hydroxyacid dehydrogenase
MLHGSESTILYEVLAWSLQNAIPQEAFLEVLHDRDPRRARDIGEILRGKLEKVPSWTAKDVHHAMEVAEEREIPMPIMSAVNAVIKLAKRENREGYTFTGMMWKFYEKTLGRI